MDSVAIIGVPSSLGGLPLGSERGPEAFREAGLLTRLCASGLEVVDLGDVPVPDARLRRSRYSGNDLAPFESIARWVAKYAWRAHAEGMLPLVIGGDHSAVIGSIAASAQSVPGVGIVWVDAHPDFNTPETTPSGNIHGMVLAIAAGRGPALLTRLAGFAPMVHPERIVVVGARSVDAAERSNLNEAGVRVYDSEYVERHGARGTVAEAMAYLATNEVRAIHLSVDLDVLNPAGWPGVSTPAEGGLTADELCLLARTVAEMAPIAAMDLVELTPAEDLAAKTAEAGIATAVAALTGSSRSTSDLKPGLSAA